MRHPKTTWHLLPFRISNWHLRSSILFKLLVLKTPRLAPGAWAEIPSWVWSTFNVFQKAYWTDLHESTYQINHNVLFVCHFHSLSLQGLAQCPGYSKQAHDKCLLNELINGQIKQWPRAKKVLEDYKISLFQTAVNMQSWLHVGFKFDWVQITVRIQMLSHKFVPSARSKAKITLGK